MLSVCGSVYMNNGNFAGFARNILDQADDPDGIEFVVADDGSGSDVVAESFEKVRSMTKGLTVVPVTRAERVDYFKRCVLFYEQEAIFPPDRISEFRVRLSRYESEESRWLWFPPNRNYNKVISMASGDVVLHTPVDVMIHFDLSQMYRRFKERMAERKYLCVFFGLLEGNTARCHGLRMFNRSLFDALKRLDLRFSPEAFSFDERWFVRAFGDDDWNVRAESIGAWARGWQEITGEKAMFSMLPGPWQPLEYLCKNMGGDIQFFMGCIKEYLRR